MYSPPYGRSRNPQSPILNRVCNVSRPASQERYSMAKRFPNNYTRLTLRPEYMTHENQLLLDNTESFLGCTTTSSNTRYYPCSNETELRLASMRIFATIMLNAWRRRREDVKRLLVKIEELKRGSLKAKNQIHVYNTLFRVEQKRNDELACQLKSSLDSILQAKSSCESLTTSVISLKADKAVLEQELLNKSRELEALTDILNQTRSELFHSMMEHRNLRSALSKEQRTVQALENQKNKLINELCQLTHENRNMQDKYNVELVKKEVDLDHTNGKLSDLESKLTELQRKAGQVDESANNDLRLRQEIEQLQERVVTLQQKLNQTFGRRVYLNWHKILCSQRKGLYMAQMLMSLLLPAVPIPTPDLQSHFNSEKVMLSYDNEPLP